MPIEHKTTLRLHNSWLKGDKDGVRADLSGTNLSGVYLMDANLSRANLEYANLSGAKLRDANLEYANLKDAYLGNAKLWGANLGGANLEDANLMDADLRGANLEGANLEGAKLRGADLENANLDYQIQEGLLQQIAKIILENPESLEMGDWHTCETTHCLSGWACYLNPVAKGLEKTHGAAIAGLLTLGYEAHAYFFKKNEEVIEWLKTIKD